MAADLGGFYEGRKVAVSGGASFIGSHLTELLVRAGAQVTVADDLSSGRKENLAACESDIRFLEVDLRTDGAAQKLCSGNELVFHLAAAHGGRGYIETHPVECLGNVALDHLVVGAALDTGVDKLVFASSACVYPVTLQEDPSGRSLLTEEQAQHWGDARPDGAYGWAKLTGELQMAAVHEQHGIATASCRIFTAYGPRENETHAVIALIAKALLRLDPYPVWGDGSQTRNFTYVSDTVMGLALAGAKLADAEAVNIGTDEHHTINEVIETIFTLEGWSPNSIDRQMNMPVGVKSRAASIDRCRELLGWVPSVELRDGLQATLEWYRSTMRPPDDLERALLER